MSRQRQARIVGQGSYLPERVLTNYDLEKMVDTSDEWITTRTGIKERRIAGPAEFSSHMGTAAAEKALKASGLAIDKIDLILVATMCPDYISPSTATIIQAQLGATQAAAMDVQAACSGYLYALSMAKAYIESGLYQNILLIATEKMSAFIDYQDRSTCVLFGDGAAAAVITGKGSGLLIGEICLGADGNMAELLMIPGGGTRNPAAEETVSQRLHYLQMEGRELFKHAVRRMNAATTACLQKAQLTEEQVSWVVPHQANERIIDALAKGLSISSDKIFKTVHKYGNTSASAVAIALDELTQTYSLKRGEHVLLVAFGAGLTWGSALLTQYKAAKTKKKHDSI